MPPKIGPFKHLPRVPFPRVPMGWKNLIGEYVDKHPLAFQYDKRKGFATPKLQCLQDHGLLRVVNKGNGTSFFTYVHIYKGPKIEYVRSLSELSLHCYEVLTINPGQRAEIILHEFIGEKNGTFIGACFDPMLDPLGPIGMGNPHLCNINF